MQTDTPQPIPEDEAATPALATAERPESELNELAEPEPAPAPEPMTPERVAAWNAYYDAYLWAGVLLLAFFGSANLIDQSSIWGRLQAGFQTLRQGAPVTTDPFSYTGTEAGRRWVNVPWVFETSHALLYRAAASMVPGEEPARAEQVGAGALVALDALARVVTIWLLLAIRRPGPGLWWAVACAMIALRFILAPAGVEPETWGQLLFAAELLLLHQAINLGRRAAIYGLVPLFLLWANVDESFLFGLLVLAAAVLGRLLRTTTDAPDPLPFARGLAVLGASAVVCLINPSLHRAFTAAAEPILGALRPFHSELTPEQLRMHVIFVALGLGSFALNWPRFSASRFLVFALAAGLGALMLRFEWAMGLALAATLTLNGQEWYQARFGTEGRVGAGWAAWSSGGRCVTIVALILFVALDLTSWGKTVDEPRFGLGFDPNAFAFEAAAFLRQAPIRGNVLNTTPEEGDALLWRAYPARKTYIDSRRHLFPPALRDRLRQTRRALRDDDAKRWQPLLDEFGISAVMIEEGSSRKTYQRLLGSQNWIPFYDDGMVVLFGRADAPEPDRSYFAANRLDANALAYERPKAAPAFVRTPRSTTWMDGVFHGRWLSRTQPHAEAARHWLQPVVTDGSVDGPAQCLLAIREARTALASRPDDPIAYRRLAEAYERLLTQESALLAGLSLDSADAANLRPTPAQTRVLSTRLRQCLTALNLAIQATPPPTTAADHLELLKLDVRLFGYLEGLKYLDLARDRLVDAVKHAQPAAAARLKEAPTPGEINRMANQCGQLDERVKEIADGMESLTFERHAGPLERAGYALRRGAPGLAIRELEEADRLGASPTLVKPRILGVYCDTGQPDKAAEIIGYSDLLDPNLGAEPGLAPFLQGLTHHLLGNDEVALALWEKHALRLVRDDRITRAVEGGVSLVRGNAIPATRAFIATTERATTQANWEFDAGMAALEAGVGPERAAEHLSRALTIAPDLPLRPVIAYYLKRLGKAVPPAPESAGGKPNPRSTRPAESQPSPADSSPDEAKAVSDRPPETR